MKKKANNMAAIKSTDYKCVIADEFEVLVDPHPAGGAAPAIGFMVYPVKVQAVYSPDTEFGTAKELAIMMTETLLFHAPHLFNK